MPGDDGEKKLGEIEQPALIIAAELNHFECMEAVLDAGSDINVQTAKVKM